MCIEPHRSETEDQTTSDTHGVYSLEEEQLIADRLEALGYIE